MHNSKLRLHLKLELDSPSFFIYGVHNVFSCLYVYMYTYIYIYIYIRVSFQHIYIYIYVYIFIFVFLFTFVHTCQFYPFLYHAIAIVFVFYSDVRRFQSSLLRTGPITSSSRTLLKVIESILCLGVS